MIDYYGPDKGEKLKQESYYRTAGMFLVNVQLQLRGKAKIRLASTGDLSFEALNKAIDSLADYPNLKRVKGPLTHKKEIDDVFLPELYQAETESRKQKDVVTLAENIFNKIAEILNGADRVEKAKPPPRKFYQIGLKFIGLFQKAPAPSLWETHGAECEKVEKFLNDEMAYADKHELNSFLNRKGFSNKRLDYFATDLIRDINSLNNKLNRIHFKRVMRKNEEGERFRVRDILSPKRDIDSTSLRAQIILKQMISHAKKKDYYDGKKYSKFNKTERMMNTEIRKFLLTHREDIGQLAPQLIEDMLAKPKSKKHEVRLAKK